MRPAAAALAALVLAACADSGATGGAASPDDVRPPLSPEEARLAFRVDDGLRVELVAAEPEVRSPIAIAFDERERLWVVEMPDYPEGPPEGEEVQGRIVVLEDGDADGRYESASVFLDGLLFATGVLPWRGGAFVTGQFGVDYIEDTDGDGRADLRRELYDGSYTEVSQHFLNTPTLGLDGWVYVANGLRTDRVFPAGSPAASVDVRGRDFRFDPLDGRYRPASGMGQFGMSLDRWGRRFTVTNRNHVIHVVAPLEDLTRSPHVSLPVQRDDQGPGGAAPVFPLSGNWTTSIRHAGTFTAACGIAVYEGDLLGERYRGSTFTAEPTGNLVHQATLTPRGASFDVGRAHDGGEFLASPDPWFRPVFVTEGPEGALYVVDMYRADIEHPIYVPEDRRARMDPRGGSGQGRIWRVVPDGASPGRSRVDLASADAAQLAETLASPNRWRRATAFRLLLQRQDRSAIAALGDIVRTSASPEARVHAAWLLHGLDALEVEHAEALLAHPHPRVREHGVRLGERWLPGPAFRERVLERVEDDDARVRFQLALSLGTLDDDRILAPLARIARRAPEDAWTRLAVASAAGRRTERLLRELLPRGASVPPGDAPLEPLVRELAAAVGAGADDGALQRTAALALSWTGDARWPVAGLQGLLEGIGRGGASPRAAADRLRRAAHDAGAGDALAALLDRLPALASDAERSPGLRRAAVRLLALAPWERSEAALAALLGDRTEPGLAAAAAETVALFEADGAGRLLLSGWRGSLPEVRRAVLAALDARPGGRALMLDALEARTIQPGELTPAILGRLRDDPALGERARGLLGAAETRRDEVVARYQGALAAGGDVDRGREVFRENCAVCHRVDGVGVAAGPDISDTRTKSREALLLDVLDPSRAVDAGYVSYSVVTASGERYSGFITARSGSAVTLRGADGRETVVPLEETGELRADSVSAMPEGFEDTIPVEDMRDLIEFLKNWRFGGA